MPQKILFITGTLVAGGAERVISVLANDLIDQYEVEIVCYKLGDVFYSIDNRVKLTMIDQKINRHSSFDKICWFRSYVQSNKPDVIIAFMAQLFFFTKISLAGVNIPIIAAERIDPRGSKWHFRLLRKILYPLSTCIVVQNEHVQSYFPKMVQQKSVIIYNPISEHFANKAAYLHTNKNKRKHIVTVGRLTSQKNHEMLVNAFREIADKFPDYDLYIYGEGPLRGRLNNYAESLGLANRVFLPGTSNQIHDILNEATLFVLTSNFEGMSNALIEAMYVGLPVISTRTAGSADLIRNGENGFLIDIGDNRQLVVAMTRVLSDHILAKNMAGQAALIQSKVEKNIVVSKWKRLIEEVTGNEKAQ